ncbi:MAG: hypothetical protein GC191_16520 [Azospirillum sp.]|nr:hypothetical protein [Azospirillum sp.]
MTHRSGPENRPDRTEPVWLRLARGGLALVAAGMVIMAAGWLVLRWNETAALGRPDSHPEALTWGLRTGGLALVAAGIRLALEPVTTVFGFAPEARAGLAPGVTVVALALALAVAAVTIAMVWVARTPGPALGLAGGGILSAVVILVLKLRGPRDPR